MTVQQIESTIAIVALFIELVGIRLVNRNWRDPTSPQLSHSEY